MSDTSTSTARKPIDRGVYTIGSIVLAIILFLAVNIFSNAVFKTARIDLTKESLFTVTQATKNILRNLDEPIVLRLYISKRVRDDIPALSTYADRVEELLRQYERLAGGNIRLEAFEPDQFSPEEDTAVGYGIQGVPASAAGDVMYFGLAGTNSTDDEDIIPFFTPGREAFLEYDLSKLVFNLSRSKKTLVGLISSLPLAADPQARYAPWVVHEQASQFFDMRIMGGEINEIDEEVDILMLVQPTSLDDRTLYAIDQYFLRGGAGLIFVDPHSEIFPQPQGRQRQYQPPPDHTLGPLFEAWGFDVPLDQVVGDRIAAQRVNAISAGRRIVTEYLPWMALERASIEPDDVVTAEIERVSLLSPGHLVQREDSTLKMTPLLFSSEQSMLIDVRDIRPLPNPLALLTNFQAENTNYVLAARFSGSFKTAFPDGPPKRVNPRGEEVVEASDSIPQLLESRIPTNIIVVADTDMLGDRSWLRGVGGTAVPIAQNGDFVVNALDNLAGSADLIALRGRGLSNRPFGTVAEIRRDAELKFRSKERELIESLRDAEQRIAELQREDQGTAILSKEQSDEIESFRASMLVRRAELREVQHALVSDIDRLESILKVLNIGAIPLLIGLFAIGLAVVRRVRFSRRIREQQA